MRCFTRQGQPHLALRQYRACADALDRELGVDPDPATVTLAQRVRHHQPV
jgi:DNA-binding SARP family transcriptional activator